MKRFVLFLSVIFSVALVACGDESSQDEVVLTLDWFPNANHAGIYEAANQGYFEDEGLDVSIEPPADPSAILSLVAAGDSDFGLFYQPDLLQARSEGVPVVAVAGIVQKPLNSMMALKESGIERPGQLAGKKVGYPGIPWNESMLATMLESDGLSLDDVELIDVGFALSQAMLAGTVDAVVGAYWTHELIVMQNEGHEANVIFPDEWGVPTYYELVLVASEETVANKPELVQRFVDAFKKGYEYALDNPQESIDTLVEANPETVDEDVDREGVELLVPLWESAGQPFGSLVPQRWTDFADWLKSQSLVDESLDPSDAFTTQFTQS